MVLTAIDGRRRALALARRVVRARLAACVQCLPVTSVYRWKGRMETAGETLLIMKTRTNRVGALMTRLRGWHSYELPEILVLPVTRGLPAYLAWIQTETT